MKKVLIVEPSRSFAQFLKYVLSRLDHEVVHYVNAKQVIEEINSVMPDLILTEINLRDLSGIELCNKLKTNSVVANIPIAIVSIDGSIETRQSAQKAGCVEYLTKPLTSRSIHELMERLLPYEHKRHNVRAKMNVNVIIHDGVKSREIKTDSIGEGGLYACTEDSYKSGTKLSIRLSLPSLRTALELQGEVVYASGNNLQSVGPKGMGIKFVGMDQNTTTLLRHYMECYLSDYLPVSPSNELCHLTLPLDRTSRSLPSRHVERNSSQFPAPSDLGTQVGLKHLA